MSLKPETIAQIQNLLQADPALLAQLQAETELAGAASVIAQAGSAQGLDVNEADVLAHLAAEQSEAKVATLSDAELEQVAGGGIVGGIVGGVLLTLMTFGVACGVLSASRKAQFGKCASFDPFDNNGKANTR